MNDSAISSADVEHALDLLGAAGDVGIERQRPVDLDDVDGDQLGLRLGGLVGREADDPGVAGTAVEGDDGPAERRFAVLRTWDGTIPPGGRLVGPASVAVERPRQWLAPVRDVGDDRVLAAEQGRLEALGGLVVEQPVPPVARHVLGQDDDGDRRLLVRAARPGRGRRGRRGRADDRPVRRLDDDQGDARDLALPALAQASPASGSSVTNTARTSRLIVRPKLTAWMTARLMPLTGMTTRCSRCGAFDDEVVADVQLAFLGVVLAPDEQHHRDEDRDEHHDEPRAVERT